MTKQDRFLILDHNTGTIISTDSCTLIDTLSPDVREMAEYWSDPNVESDEIAIRLHELFGSGLNNILENSMEVKLRESK